MTFSIRKYFALYLITLSIFLISVPISCKSKGLKNTDKTVRQPAEFEKQSAVWVIWPTEDHIQGMSNEEVTSKIIQALQSTQKVFVAVNDLGTEKRAKDILLKTEGSLNNINFLIIPSIQMWIRDMGPNFVINQQNKKEIVDFNFNSWGYATLDDPNNQIEEKFDELVAQNLKLKMTSTDVVSEGGNREVNGKGSLMTVETVELERNPNRTKKELEKVYQETLGVTNIIWLKEGVREDDHTFRGPILTASGEPAYTVLTTNGHIDEFARFINPTTILLAEVDKSELSDPIAAENHRRMEENFEILKNAKDQDGNPFKIIRMPMPKTILGTLKPGDPVYDYISELDYENGHKFPIGEPVKGILAASYLNFLIANEVVLMQKYYEPGMDEYLKETDEKAKKILEEIFPNKKIIPINATAINFGGGGIHCITMQEPAN